ncbi:MAG: T9SS type A sorting domain-containing protein [Chitinophagaceae bacterium]|nr:MAG: T9SS type A sorting domain-containing protein [Chitinophagaceae bacterium]
MKRFIYTLLLAITTSAGGAYAQAFTAVERVPSTGIRTGSPVQHVITAFPNPAQSYTTIVLHSRSRQRLVAEVLDFNGNLYHTQAYAPGIDQVNIELGNLERGQYLIRIRETGRRTESVRIIKN